MCGMHQGPADHGPAVLGLTPKGSSWDWGSPGLEAQSGERMVSIGWHDIFFIYYIFYILYILYILYFLYHVIPCCQNGADIGHMTGQVQGSGLLTVRG